LENDDLIILKDVRKLADEFSQEFRNKGILVTGGAGFLGSWLCDVFVESGADVDCLDNFSTSTGKNIEHLKNALTLINSNIEDVNLEDKDYDYIFHFSSRASPDEYIHHPIETMTANSTGTMKMLDLAHRRNSRLVSASTSEIYGDAKVVPTPETYYGNTNSIGIRSCYDEGKRYAESLCMAYMRQKKVDVRLARIFNSYGPRIRADGLYGRALPRFIRQALKGEPITIYGDGNQTRSFCYVTDTIRGILKLSLIKNQSGLVVNIGNPNEMTILELAQKIIEKTGSESRLSFGPIMQDDPLRRCADIRKAREVLGWAPLVNFDDGISRTIDWFRSQLAGNGIPNFSQVKA